MANIVPFDQITVPAFLQNRAVANDVFAAGLPQGGGYPTIAINGTRFVSKVDGVVTPLKTLDIGVVLVSAKPNLDKAYYASKYNPNEAEAKSSDCFSKDGIKPDAAATLKQCESCAGCPMNQFGSGTDQNGNPGKGKACSDAKILALFANNGIYGFKIPPASLKAFGNYVKETSRRGVDLSTAITVIGFDPNFSFPVLTFNFGGFLAEEQVNKIAALKGSQEVADIIGGTATQVAPAALKQVEAPKVEATPDPFAAVEEAPVAKPVEKPKVVKAVSKPVEKPVEIVEDDLSDLAAELGLSL